MTQESQEINDIIKLSIMEFHDSEFIPNQLNIFDPNSNNQDDPTEFGILTVELKETPITKNEQFILFTIDTSGSMGDMCSDGFTKLQYVIHTLINIFKLFAENEDHTEIHIQVEAFNNYTETIIEETKITSKNINNIIEKIKKVISSNNTNTENALKRASNIIDLKLLKIKQKIINVTHVSHIFMTDGKSTYGNTDPEYLQTLLKKEIPNIFIGFGIEHDSNTLNILSSIKNASYYFVDVLEKAGMVYGEIIHNILYKALEDIEIEIKNGKIYNWKTNTWDEKINIDMLIGEAIKVYHICGKKSEIQNIECKIKGKIINHDKNQDQNQYFEIDCDMLPKLLDLPTDLNNYLFRQRTQELLYLVRNLEKNTYNSITNNLNCHLMRINTQLQIVDTDDLKELKQKLKEFLNHMKKYMVETDQMNDPFMKNLCDDIYIVYRTIGTVYSDMYSSARHTSQGRQQSYNVNSINEEELTKMEKIMNHKYKLLSNKLKVKSNNNFKLPLPKYSRQKTQTIFTSNTTINSESTDFYSFINYDLSESESESESTSTYEHSISERYESPYASPLCVKIMKNISKPISTPTTPKSPNTPKSP
jgi:uncharacterized protein YegL